MVVFLRPLWKGGVGKVGEKSVCWKVRLERVSIFIAGIRTMVEVLSGFEIGSSPGHPRTDFKTQDTVLNTPS